MCNYFQSQQNNANQAGRSVNDGGRTMKVSQIDGFMDLVWNPAVDVIPHSLSATKPAAAIKNTWLVL